MQDRPPVLEALPYLRAFALAARHVSFKRAAHELHVTPSAVSQQMRALESLLGLKLFLRQPRALALTPSGAQLAAVVHDVFERLNAGTAGLLQRQEAGVLRLTTDPSVAHEVLIPALPAFAAMRPDIELRLETSTRDADLFREELDAAVRYGVGPWPGLSGTVVCQPVVTAVCAPGLVPRNRIRSPEAFADYPLIRLRDQPDPWTRLAKVLSLELPRNRLILDSYMATVRAAEQGLGIAMGVFPTTTTAVLEGRLVTPFPVRVRTRARFHFLCKKQEAHRAELNTLREWASTRFAELPVLPSPRDVATVDEPR